MVLSEEHAKYHDFPRWFSRAHMVGAGDGEIELFGEGGCLYRQE